MQLRHNIFVIIILGVLLWGRTLWFDFTFDDQAHIFEAEIMQDDGAWQQAFTKPTWPGNLYRPIPVLSFYLTKKIVGLDPFLYHLTNLTLHLLVSLLVLLTLRELLSAKLAFYSTLIFLVHPIHTEVVANIANRTEMFAALFFLLAFLSFSKSRFFLGGIAFLFSLLSKEGAIGGVILLPFLFKNSYKKVLAAISFATAIMLLMRFSVININQQTKPFGQQIDNVLQTLPFFERLPFAVSQLGHYLRLILVPFQLLADYSFPQFNLGSDVLYGCTIISLFLSYIFVGYKRDPDQAKFVLWFFLLFGLTSNILFPIGTHFGLRLAYLPSIGIIALVSKALPIRALSLIVVVFAILSFTEIGRWKNNYSLWESELQRGNISVRATTSAATQKMLRGEKEEAIVLAERANQILPNFTPALRILQRLYLQKRELTKAENILTTLYQQDSTAVVTLDGLGWLKFYQGDLLKSAELFNQAVKADPFFVSSKIGLFSIAVKERNLAEIARLENEIPTSAKRDPRFREAQAGLS